MVIIQLIGGMGNQMFQYALYQKYLSLGTNTKLDCLKLNNYIKEYNRQTIFKEFNLSLDQADINEIHKLKDDKKDIYSKVRRKIFGRKKTHYKEPESGKYIPEILNFNNVYLEGFWQAFEYFDDIRDVLLKKFHFNRKLNERNTETLHQINSCNNSVSIHIRLGDYLSNTNKIIYGNICNSEYYENCIGYINNIVPDTKFFVFSNDIAAAKIQFGVSDKFIYVDNNDEKNGYFDMMLMSQCKHNIIANSTFSWWGAYLNCNKNKIILAPKKWMNDFDMPDIYCPGWIKV